MTHLHLHGAGLRLFITAVACEQMREAAAHAWPLEQTGPLFGVYADSARDGVLDTAVVVEAPTATMSATATSCERDGDAVNAMCAKRWPGTFFLGTWHTHPLGAPTPSAEDIAQLLRDSTDTNCPEPVMVILGGMFSNPDWSAHVVRDGVVHELQRQLQ